MKGNESRELILKHFIHEQNKAAGINMSPVEEGRQANLIINSQDKSDLGIARGTGARNINILDRETRFKYLHDGDRVIMSKTSDGQTHFKIIAKKDVAKYLADKNALAEVALTPAQPAATEIPRSVSPSSPENTNGIDTGNEQKKLIEK